jgi:hypothetical protein
MAPAGRPGAYVRAAYHRIRESTKEFRCEIFAGRFEQWDSLCGLNDPS